MKRGKVLVSVVMSVYNDEQYLKESLDSIFAQTISDFELIIVDDCSTDRTVEIIENYHDDRIRLIRNTESISGTTSGSDVDQLQDSYVWRRRSDLADSGNTEATAGDDVDSTCIGASRLYDAQGADCTGRLPI